jgi:copper homeostasis protein
MVIEVCLAGIESAVSAQTGGATRIELCENLAEGGTTPSQGTIALVREKLSIPVHVMIRPRGGDFCYSDLEFEVMQRDVAKAVSLGVDGVVFGLLTPEGQVDIERSRILMEIARPLAITFHRAFDVAADPFAAFEDLLTLGVNHLLTSGQQVTAWEGRKLIKLLQGRANGRLRIMAGSGINASNAAALIAATGLHEIHVGSACMEVVREQIRRRVTVINMSKGTPEFDQTIRRVSAMRVREIVEAVRRYQVILE